MTEDKDKEGFLTDMKLEWEELKLQRRKTISRRTLPENRILLTALLGMTKQELDDIRYNLCVSGISSLKKMEMAQASGCWRN